MASSIQISSDSPNAQLRQNSGIQNVINNFIGLISLSILSRTNPSENTTNIASPTSIIENSLESLITEIENIERENTSSNSYDSSDNSEESNTETQYLFHINYVFNEVDEKIDNKNKIKKLPSYKKIKKDDPLLNNCDNCSICLNKYEEGKFKRELPCKHTFHKSCIDKWLKKDKHMTCPLCKTKYDNYK